MMKPYPFEAKPAVGLLVSLLFAPITIGLLGWAADSALFYQLDGLVSDGDSDGLFLIMLLAFAFSAIVAGWFLYLSGVQWHRRHRAERRQG